MSVNPERAEPGWPSAVVASSYLTGMLLMRNLERRGVKTCCVDHNLDNPGFRSVYGKTHACMDPDVDPEGWVRFMVNLAGTFGTKPVLVPASDQYVSAMAAHAEILGKHFTFFTGNIQLQAALCMKQSLYDLAGEHGFPIPRTRSVSTDADLGDFAATAKYPCLMKPQQARLWLTLPEGHPCCGEKLIRAVSKEDLIAKYASVRAVTPDVVVQEEILGPDTSKLVYLPCYSHTGDRLGYAMVRELRTDYPIHFGSACMVEPAADAEIEGLCDGFLRKLKYRGLCEIEVKRDSRDGVVKMIEANPRYTITSDAAPYDGVDIGWLHYLDLIGQPVSPVKPLGRKFRHAKLTQDIQSMRFFVAAGEATWWSIIKSYRPPVYFFDVDPKDWRNFLKTLMGIGRTVGGIVRRKIFGNQSMRRQAN
jgi:D-aspartate ligase